MHGTTRRSSAKVQIWAIAAAGLLAAPAAQAAEERGPRIVHEVGIGLSFPTGVAPTLSYAPMLTLFGDRLRVGLGARFSAYVDDHRVAYPNGDAHLLAIGANNTLTVDGPRNHAFNVVFAASVRILRGLEAGLDIDLIGVGFGPEITGSYAGTDPAFAGPQQASPSRFDLLLFGTHDYGQLDSEFFLAYWFGSWGVRAGVSHMSTEYTTTRPLDAGNDRFRTSATRFFLAGGYRF